MWTKEIKVNGMFDFDYTLLRFSFDPLVDLNREERWVRIPLRLGTEKHIVKVRAIGTPYEPVFEIQGNDEAKKDKLMAFINDIFLWDRDLRPIQQFFQKTKLAPLFEQYPGTPIVKDFHPFDCLMKTIIHQQLNMKFAYTLTTRYIQNFGEEINGVWFQPTPEKVASLDYDALRELQFSQRKAEYVIDTARKIADGKLDLQKLSGLPDEDVLNILTKVRGVGPWTVENWLMFGLGRENLLPAADIGIQNALKKFLGKDKKPHKDDIYQMGEEWSPYRSYASLTLWRSIEG
ncbi:DNA-3-methyladenine glycosylase 2 family protein [Virgibacillus sp. MSP4-1]|uniref:DNA-3-methyladenine glycosylase family protein n=1 Tax=Virgibacillus sp. MSP4-1 TaxID=2700081 RepID=UPI0003A3C620|nr:DNA-3-methyladenine glycosylase [Virgibacillus sp. MSP4-1]QHS24243.1 DNA-3-methyladenine glycosylase 2 family protein [Virgibacillus sp. MSP4-1]